MFGLIAYPALGAYKSVRSSNQNEKAGVEAERLSSFQLAGDCVHSSDISALVKAFRNIQLE